MYFSIRQVILQKVVKKIESMTHLQSTFDMNNYMSSFKESDPIGSNQLWSFIESVCHLAWQMSIQQPPMVFRSSGIGEEANETWQRVLPSRDMDTSQQTHLIVDYYLEPALIHGETVIEKGRVMLRTVPLVKDTSESTLQEMSGENIGQDLLQNDGNINTNITDAMASSSSGTEIDARDCNVLLTTCDHSGENVKCSDAGSR